MKVLFIGGTGIISSACSKLAVKHGIDLYLLNRGMTSRHVPKEATVLRGDIRDREAVSQLLKNKDFDAVVDWIAFTTDHIETDLHLFKDHTAQFIFISSASAYQTPLENLPITETTPLLNPFWEYSRNKIACEDRLFEAYRQEHFPVTIVRPSHTYDCTRLPFHGQYTVIDRMRKGKKVIVHGDGTSLWVLTHHADFATGLVGLLGNHRALGEAYHITSDEILTWNLIYELLAQAAGTRTRIVHVPSDSIAEYDPHWGAGLLGDKSHSVIFDNTKIKEIVPEYRATIPYSRGAEEIMKWFDADSSRRKIDRDIDRMMDTIIATYESAFPSNIS